MINKLIDTLQITPSGFLQFNISVELDGVKYSTITTNNIAVKESELSFNETNNEHKYHLSQNEAKQELVNEIMKINF